MKIIRFDKIKYIPASHENPKDPGVLKKILANKKDLLTGQLQMINWAKLLPNKTFVSHYHQDMQEIFIILSGQAKFIIDEEEKTVKRGDVIIVPIKKLHSMKNKTNKEIEYIVMGIATNKGGKTVIESNRQ